MISNCPSVGLKWWEIQPFSIASQCNKHVMWLNPTQRLCWMTSHQDDLSHRCVGFRVSARGRCLDYRLPEGPGDSWPIKRQPAGHDHKSVQPISIFPLVPPPVSRAQGGVWEPTMPPQRASQPGQSPSRWISMLAPGLFLSLISLLRMHHAT